MENNKLNAKGIIDSIDRFNEHSEQICISLNGLEESLNGFNKSISKLDELKEIDFTKEKIDQLKKYKDKTDEVVKGLQTIDKDLDGIEDLIKNVSKFAEEIQSVMKESHSINFNNVSKNVREIEKRLNAFNKRIDTFVQSELLKKLDTHYENLVEYFDKALENQKNVIDSIEGKLEEVTSQQNTIRLSSGQGEIGGSISLEGLDISSIKSEIKNIVEETMKSYIKEDTSKISIYRGFSEKVLKTLSEEGELEASYILGERYYDLGKIDEAVVEYEKLVDSGDERCKEKLIEIYYKKVEEENPIYQEKLGFELYRGKIIEKDIEKAITLLEKAERNGSINSKRYLELIRLK